MKTAEKTVIDLSPEQSKIWNESGKVLYLFPLEPQPERCDHYGWKWNGWKFPDWRLIKNNIIRFAYPTVGQKVSIRQAWGWMTGSDCFFGGVGKYPFCGTGYEDEPAKTMPPELLKAGEIVEVLEPKRIQDIDDAETLLKLGMSEAGAGAICGQGQLKDWFNKQFSKPRPVKCIDCVGDGTGHYTCCWHDDDLENAIRNLESLNETTFYYDVLDDNLTVFSQWKGKDLKIIVNPFVGMVLIQKGEK